MQNKPEGFKAISLNPLLGYIDRFLPKEICDSFLSKVDYSMLAPSSVGGAVKDFPGNLRDDVRTARDIAFAMGQNVFIDDLRRRVTSVLNLSAEHCEAPALIHYPTGGQYKVHFDTVSFGSASKFDTVSHVRAYTAILYLNDDFEGGETEFPHLKTSIQPRTGRLVIWQNMAAASTALHPLSAHAGLPVLKGEKNILSFWMTTPMCLQAQKREGIVSEGNTE